MKLSRIIRLFKKELKENSILRAAIVYRISSAFVEAYYKNEKEYKNKKDVEKIATEAALLFLEKFTE